MADAPRDNQADTHKSRGGRPRAAAPRSSAVSLRLTADEHDRVIRLALKHDRSVASTLRQLLIARLR